MKNWADWKTTIPALVAAVGSAFFGYVLYAGSSVHFPTWLVALAGFAAAGGLAVLGINASSVKPPEKPPDPPPASKPSPPPSQPNPPK